MDDENLCERCGECCKVKNPIGNGKYFQHERYCEYLRFNKDGTTRCAIYDNVRQHQKTNSGNICTSAKRGVELGVMRPDCPYAKREKNYKYNIIKKGDKPK